MKFLVKKLVLERGAYGSQPLSGSVILSDGEAEVRFDLSDAQARLIDDTAIFALNKSMESLALSAARFKDGRY